MNTFGGCMWTAYIRCMCAVQMVPVFAAKKNKVNADPFEYVKDVDMNKATGGANIFKGVVSSGWTVIMLLSAVGFVMSLMVCGFRLLLFPKETADVKKHIITKSLLFIGVCGGTFLFSLFMEIAKNLF